jgi:hypothetical protein
MYILKYKSKGAMVPKVNLEMLVSKKQLNTITNVFEKEISQNKIILKIVTKDFSKIIKEEKALMEKLIKEENEIPKSERKDIDWFKRFHDNSKNIY